MKQEIFSKLKETSVAVLPIAGILLLLHFTIAPMPSGILALFLSGTVLLIIGMTLFQLGSDLGMTPMGNQIGSKLVEKRSLSLFIFTAFLLGFLVTVAEPDLHVLSNQMPALTFFTLLGFDFSVGTVLIYAVALGVGLFLMLAVLRIVLGWNLSRIFFFLYLAVFGIAIFTQKEYLAVAFDSGGVTTGPITVPFILALGVGIASVSGGEKSQDDSFGLVALCSVGPILTVLIMGMFIQGDAVYEPTVIPETVGFLDIFLLYHRAVPVYAKEVLLALLPILAVYFLFQILFLKLPKKTVRKTFVGVLYTYIGLVIFLTAANVGFLPAGSFVGGALATLKANILIVPIGMVVGYFIVAAEPAVHVLTEQVEDVTDGAISRKAIMGALMIGMSVSVGLAMTRVLTGLSIWFLLIPGYAVALGLTFFVPKIFTAIAFDSGGVASGPMTATFLLPFAMGACQAIGGNVLLDGFGVVAMVAMTPLVTIQILGAVYAVKEKKLHAHGEKAVEVFPEEEFEEIVFEFTDDDEIIEFDF